MGNDSINSTTANILEIWVIIHSCIILIVALNIHVRFSEIEPF